MNPEPEAVSRSGRAPRSSSSKPETTSITPRCAVFAACGGCSRQDIPGAVQLADKQALLQRELAELAGIEPESYQLLPPVTGPQWNYRRKARLTARLVRRKGGVLVGFREKRGGFVTDMKDCEVLVAPLAALIRPLRALLDGMAAREAIPQIEVSAGESDAGGECSQSAIVLRHMRPLGQDDLQRLSEFAVRWRLQIYLQPGGVDSVRRLYPRSGPERLHYHLPKFGLRLAFHPMDFLQVNAVVNRRAIDLVSELLDLRKHDRLLDLFCGPGNFSLPLATRCGHVTGIENSGEMVARAVENAQANGITNAGFIAADLYRKHPLALPQPPESCNRILLDPPRSGALETIPLIAASGADRVVYVSCNPESLARDARELRRRGFDLKSAGVMDMFPHTLHVESVAMFESARQRAGSLP